MTAFVQRRAGPLLLCVAVALGSSSAFGHDRSSVVSVAASSRRDSQVDGKVDGSGGGETLAYVITTIVTLIAILVASLTLYAADVYVTSRMDELLLEYYGPELYEKYTSDFDATQDQEDLHNYLYGSANSASDRIDNDGLSSLAEHSPDYQTHFYGANNEQEASSATVFGSRLLGGFINFARDIYQG